jgi:8-oxo-dGTP pyrophosphatase MutT (NUDIX family)
LEPFPIRRTAAVLVPVYEARRTGAGLGSGEPARGRPAEDASEDAGADGDEPEVHVLLTRRPWTMRAHSGEVAFPGGGRDPEDADLESTARREAWEEIGLAPDRVEIVGQLDPLATLSSGAHITPFVGVVRDLPELRPSPHEVAAILRVPFHELLEPGVYHEERWGPIAGMAGGTLTGPGIDKPFPTPDGLRPMHFFDLAGDTVWGATARMLFQLLTIATGTEAALEAQRR